jgi:hypothetical protein
MFLLRKVNYFKINIFKYMEGKTRSSRSATKDDAEQSIYYSNIVNLLGNKREEPSKEKKQKISI